jgi:NAD(P)-dependent dehydrogenase (short-subunit alcohol dehydrogenase family)
MRAIAGRLAGKRTIITGAGSGIGAATASLFAAEGAYVLVVDRNGTAAIELVTRINEVGGRAVACTTDVASEQAVAAMVAQAHAELGGVDILVNNAGVGGGGDVLNATDESIDYVFGVNVKGPLFCCKYVLPEMVRQGGGAIVNVASISSTCGIPGQSVYGPSKGAVWLFTRQLAVEYAARGVRVNSVAPGTIETPMIGGPTAGRELSSGLRYLLDHHPIGRFGTPLEVARAILFLASDEASFITGANLAVDGGYTAQ